MNSSSLTNISNRPTPAMARTSKSRVVATPRPFRTPRKIVSTAGRRKRPASAACGLQTPDRFIPNRSRMDVSRAQASLRTENLLSSNSKWASPSSRRRDAAYQCQLRRALWGSSDEVPRMMSFGSSSSKAAKPPCIRPTHLFVENGDPYRQDILRPARALATAHETVQPSNRIHYRHPKESIEFLSNFSAAGILEDDHLTLIGCGKHALAVALDCTIYLIWEDGKERILAQNYYGVYSCVKWNDDGTLLAVGMDGNVCVYQHPDEPSNTGSNGPIVHLRQHWGYVTAIAWKGMEIVVACENGLTRYDLRQRQQGQILVPEACYQGFVDNAERVAALAWKDSVIASAGEGQIKLWDSNECGGNIPPRCVMTHDGVKSLEFCEQSSYLISGGDHGLKYWNFWSGKLRASIDTGDETVTSTVCLPNANGILVATGHTISLWTTTGRLEKITEQDARAGKILSMVQARDGTIVCAHSDELLSLHTVRRHRSQIGEQGLLNMPIIR